MSITLSNWKYREVGTDTWYPSTVGSCAEIYPDLLLNNQIPDPFLNDNESKVQWVAERDWEYETTFTYQNDKKNKKMLVFEGLDTFATIFLNGKQILETSNMFLSYSISIRDAWLVTKNELRITFHSALRIGKQLEKRWGQLKCWNGDPCRLYVRKAQYQFGWDWGPVLINCGPYKETKFISYECMFKEVHVSVKLNHRLDQGTVTVKYEVEGNSRHFIKTAITLSDGTVISSKTSECRGRKGFMEVKINNPELWYPCGYGKQFLYTVVAELYLLESGQLLHSEYTTVGFKNVELVEEPLCDQEGTSFYFKINNIPVYISGLNWIPAHSFTTKVKKHDYTKWLQMAISCNQNMVRVWGGGYYESDFFYLECDRLGIMVWQDFMFACGQYPANVPAFLDTVKEEISQQLKRLSIHPSIAIYSGNNEDYQIAEVYKLCDNSDSADNYLETNFPAREVYEKIIPKLMTDLHPNIPYRYGSPWGGNSTRDSTVGDIHQWDVWHGAQEKYQDWYKLGGRFISEFGMEALPSLSTLESCILDRYQLHPQSKLLDYHNKALGFERRLATYVIENIKLDKFDLKSWIYATQLMQAECLAYALRSFRRQWKGGQGRRYVGGFIIWQLNDCWPVTSWSIVDFYRKPKLAYYSVKRESKPITLGISRNENNRIDIWGVNTSTTKTIGNLLVYFYEVSTGELVQIETFEDVHLNENQSTDLLLNFAIPCPNVVVYCKLISDVKRLAHTSDWPQPLKYLQFHDRQINYVIESDYIKLSLNKPVKGVEIQSETYLEDNGIDIFPCDTEIIQSIGMKSTDKVMVNFYK